MGRVLLLLFLFLCLFGLHSAVEDRKPHPKCPPFPCGKLGELKFPFTNTTRPPHCGLLVVDGCDSDTQMIQLERKGRRYKVVNVSSENAIFIQDEAFSKQLYSRDCKTFNDLNLPRFPYLFFEIEMNVSMFKCAHKLSDPALLEQRGCSNFSIYYSRKQQNLPRLPPHCSLLQLPLYRDGNYSDIFTLLTGNFSIEVNLSPQCWNCHYKGGECWVNSKAEFYCADLIGAAEWKWKGKLGIVAALSVAGIGLIMIIICCYRRKFSFYNFIFCSEKKRQDHQSIESFLRNHKWMALKRYEYTEVRKMTVSYKDKLGEGGYGSVFKGKLPDGCLVAVKVLKDSKSSAEDFINEIASISRTSHVNVVALLGFCFEGSKRALVYEFMPNGSLDKYLHKDHQLDWETLYQIAICIAPGLEYLHRGCNTRILHLDIKPHNILLDENFVPKISDFGLARICIRKESMISVTGPRGTPGYIAPEVFSRCFGRVSHKSDVYSYGMLVLEMVGGRKNMTPVGDHSSEIYFPESIFKRLLQEELGFHGMSNEEDEQIARKMVVVSLWCIQTDPSNRPAISRVIEMMEGSIESLPIPPKPNLVSPERSPLRSLPTSSTIAVISP